MKAVSAHIYIYKMIAHGKLIAVCACIFVIAVAKIISYLKLYEISSEEFTSNTCLFLLISRKVRSSVLKINFFGKDFKRIAAANDAKHEKELEELRKEYKLNDVNLLKRIEENQEKLISQLVDRVDNQRRSRISA